MPALLENSGSRHRGTPSSRLWGPSPAPPRAPWPCSDGEGQQPSGRRDTLSAGARSVLWAFVRGTGGFLRECPPPQCQPESRERETGSKGRGTSQHCLSGVPAPGVSHRRAHWWCCGQSPVRTQQGRPATMCTSPRRVLRQTQAFPCALYPRDLPLCSCSGPQGLGAGGAGQHRLPVGAGQEDHRHLLAVRRRRSAPLDASSPRLSPFRDLLSRPPLLAADDKATGGTSGPS